ncbi:MAG: hypothetical protein J2P56_06845 [Verrucomicrobia bacterium]|nr:hypothetical protein [Verrucomicrobiota bacterium]
MFNEKTRWKMPGATEFITLTWLQDWSVRYNQAPNRALVPRDMSRGSPSNMGMFFLDATGHGGYEADFIIKDGPIIYGAGFNDEDRQKAWQDFFMVMFRAAVKQQGESAVGVMLKRRCLPWDNFCTTVLDAKLAGVAQLTRIIH